jgi:hypothetical protein
MRFFLTVLLALTWPAVSKDVPLKAQLMAAIQEMDDDKVRGRGGAEGQGGWGKRRRGRRAV